MKQTSILIIFICFTFSLAYSQLSVRNNAYVFVTDEIVYVEDDVKIEETTANMYLRDEAQLIQGAGLTGNSGRGKLSVFQDGTSNAYAYNYWCSPVGNINVNDNANRTFIPNENIFDYIGDGITPTPNPILSVPATFTSNYNGVTNATNNATTPMQIAEYWLWAFRQGTVYSDWEYIGNSNPLETGYGFTMKGNNSGGETYDFRGKPNNGTIEVDVAADQEVLIGNPYPSAIDALLLIHDTDNTDIAASTDYIPTETDGPLPATTGALLYWQQQPGASSHLLEDYVGGYAIYTISAGGVETFSPAPFRMYLNDGSPTGGAPVGYGTKVAKRYIPIGQGFMMKGASGIPANSKVRIKNSHRVYYKESGTDSYFFRNSQNTANTTNSSSTTNETEYDEYGYNIVPENFQRFRVNIGFNDTYKRQLVINLTPEATEGFDYGLEGEISEADLVSSDAHWTLDNKPYLIQAFEFDTSLRIPLIVKTEFQQVVEFSTFDVQNFDDSQPIYLYDSEDDQYYDLRTQNQSLTLEAGTYNDRFEIVFENQRLSLEEVNNALSNTLTALQNNTASELVIKNPQNIDLQHLSLYDISGKRVLYNTNLGTANTHTIPTKNLSDGTYILSLNAPNMSTFTKKIIIRN